MNEKKQELREEIVEKYESGMTQYALAREYGVQEYYIKNVLIKAGVELRDWRHRKKEVDVNRLRELAEMGYTAAEIGKELGAGSTTIGLRLSENGIRINEEKKRQRLKERGRIRRKLRSTERKKCNTCRYRSGSQGTYGCDYWQITETCRHQPAIGCTFYEKGARIRPESAAANEIRRRIKGEER